MTFEGTELFRLDTQGASDNPFCVALVPGAEAAARVRRAQPSVAEARAALERGSFVACANAAQMALTGDTTARAQLDARWLIAQCSLLAHDAVAAGDSLREFKDNANLKDPRMPLVRAQLTALERGALPDGVRTAPASQAEATALAARLNVASEGKAARREENPTFSVSLGTPVVLGPRDPRTIDRVLQKKLNELIGCLPPGAMTAGERRRIVMKWVIDAKGKVPQAKVDELDGLNTVGATCLTGRVRSWKFPSDGRDGGITIVTQPFVFQSFETRSEKEP